MKRRKAERTDEAANRAAQRLSALIRIPAVAPAVGAPLTPEQAELFASMRSLLTESYPLTFSRAQIDEAGRAGLLLRLEGRVSERPVVLMAHQDVVPVPEDWQAEGWEHAPFEGVIADGFVYGRGALDDKGALVVMLEAVEELLAGGWEPPRDLYLLMGADEEAYGDCAIQATELLRSRGIEPYLVLDEGGAVATGAFPTVKRELAVVGVSEKGILTLEISADGGGGHASTPPKRSAAGLVAAAICEIEEHPFPAAVNDVTVEMFESVAPHASRTLRGLLRRAGALRPVLARLLPRLGPEMAAMVRTTTAVTMLEGSPAHNVLATRARAVLNVRVASGMTVDEATAYLTKVIDDKRITVTVLERSEPSPVSPSGDDPRWRALREAVAASYPEAVMVPYVMLAASDGRHLARIAPAVYRFAPLRMSSQQRAAVHGPNEKVEVESLGRGAAFYRALLTGRLMETGSG